MGTRVRVSDIAERAGVSTATVSRVLNDPHLVRTETRDQIYSAMRDLNYVPPSSHRDPETRSHILGFFAPNLLLDSAIELLRAVEAELAATEFDVLIVNMRGNRDFFAFISSNAHILKKIDGAIVFSADISEQAVEFMKSADTPLVLMQARSQLVRAVSNNNFRGGQDAGEHLLACGYRSPAFIGWNPEDDHVTDRLAGFRAALTPSIGELPERARAFGELSIRGGYHATIDLLERFQPDAIFFACDVMAIGGMKRLREMGIRVPEDIGVMGFDDLAIAEAVGLTTLHQFFSTKAEMIVRYLLDRLSGAVRTDKPEELQVSPRLVVRETTRTVAREAATRSNMEDTSP